MCIFFELFVRLRIIICKNEQIYLKFLKNDTSEKRHEFAISIVYNDVENILVVIHEFRKHYIDLFCDIVNSFARNKQYSFKKLIRNDKKKI